MINLSQIRKFNCYPLVICYIAIENTPFSSLIYLFKMVIYVMFYSYVTVYQREIYIFAGNPSMFPPISCVMFEAGDHAIYIPRRKSQEKIP